MKSKLLLLSVIAAIIVAMVTASSASPAAPAGISLLSSQSVLTTTQTVYANDGTGQYGTSTAALDTAATNAVVGSDGYLCGDVQYRATQRWYDIWGITLWTYRSTFGVHVCHNKVGYKTALYDEPMDSTLGWSWCGNIIRDWGMNPNNASAHSYTKGCFTVFYKIADTRYPWAKMTIGGNGNLWVRNTGVGS